MTNIEELRRLRGTLAANGTITEASERLWSEFASACFDALPGLLDELEELRADKARLDWLEKTLGVSGEIDLCLYRYPDAQVKLMIHIPGRLQFKVAVGGTLREAINEATAETGGAE